MAALISHAQGMLRVELCSLSWHCMLHPSDNSFRLASKNYAMWRRNLRPLDCHCRNLTSPAQRWASSTSGRWPWGFLDVSMTPSVTGQTVGFIGGPAYCTTLDQCATYYPFDSSADVSVWNSCTVRSYCAVLQRFWTRCRLFFYKKSSKSRVQYDIEGTGLWAVQSKDGAFKAMRHCCVSWSI